MKRNRNPGRNGKLLFFAPIVLVVGLVILGFYSAYSSRAGTLVVDAISSGRYSPSIPLHATATVGTTTQATPFNVTLNQGEYMVDYGAVAWYAAPSSRAIFVPAGKSLFAIGVYNPILRVIAASSQGFNSTSVSALHGVTPVVWVNLGGSYVVLEIDGVGRVTLQPSQNYTRVFQNPGTFYFDIFDTSFVGSVRSI